MERSNCWTEALNWTTEQKQWVLQLANRAECLELYRGVEWPFETKPILEASSNTCVLSNATNVQYVLLYWNYTWLIVLFDLEDVWRPSWPWTVVPRRHVSRVHRVFLGRYPIRLTIVGYINIHPFCRMLYPWNPYEYLPGIVHHNFQLSSIFCTW